MPEVSLQVDQAQIKAILDLFARYMLTNLSVFLSSVLLTRRGHTASNTRKMISLSPIPDPLHCRRLSNYFRWSSLRRRYPHPSYTIAQLLRNQARSVRGWPGWCHVIPCLVISPQSIFVEVSLALASHLCTSLKIHPR